MNLKEIERQIDILMQREDRKDSPFRAVILMDQIGSMVRYTSHDQKENPNARPHGSRDGEISAIGHSVLQLIGYARSRDISIDDAICHSLPNWIEADWRKRVCSDTGALRGLVAYPGEVLGVAYVDPNCRNLDEMPDGSILVTGHPGDEIGSYMTRFGGIITDHGGMTCHAAKLAGEYNVPCIVGTGNATNRIYDRQKISMKLDGAIELF